MMFDKLHHLAFSSNKNNIHLVERFVENLCDYYNINSTYFGNILTAVTEAVENAIYHGNRGDSTKKIYLKFEVKSDGFSFKIKDQGLGFNINSVPDPTDENADFSQTEGRGLFIMKSLADAVIFHEKGSCVELIFKISSITKQISDDRINTYLSKIKSKQNTKKA